ncbi:HEAT repeat-containing protein 1-like [Uloborus diversus]|uniref:HEAT repeat-containing protein 1-like n=1 Tax=Uloborus diversus TaxID=327109 RepID=UPI00240A10B1|nr:HEAT repeat-containing protein 1-like [Uloborus diversus]
MAGETALARQLKKLSVPQTSAFTQDKIRKSFLFDHRDAASLDRDVIFAYGVTGFEKLNLISPLFEKYGKNLFSTKYKDFERSVQTADVNKKLDAKINDFLTLLSPYFLIRAAHEALEWLIYRFHIHLYNTDALMSSALPHFNSSVFVRVVQLLTLDNENNRWFWLKPIQTSGSHLEYSAILNRFNSDGGFRKLICGLAPKILTVYGAENAAVAVPIISFSTLTVYCALDRCKNIGDSLILFLLPYILKGLSSGVNKYIASTYLIISKIIVNVKLSNKIIEELLIKIFLNLNKDLMKEALELVILIYQQQSKQQTIKSKKLKRSLKEKVKYVIKSLELNYPGYFDKALNMFMQKKSPFRNKITKKLLNDSVCSIKFKVLQDAKTTLVLGLNHPNQHIRSQSIKMLLQEVAEGVEHDVFVKELLFDRLFDESTEIVEELLSFPEVLISVLGKEKLLNAVINISSTDMQRDSKWYPVHMQCLNLLCGYFSDTFEQDHQFENLQQVFWFLSVTWLNVSGSISHGMQITAIKNACLVFPNEKSLNWLFEDPLYLLVIMHSASSAVDEIRQSALSLLSSVIQHVDAGQNIWMSLFKEICANAEEIQTDHRQFQYVTSNWLRPAIEDSKSGHSEINSKIEILDVLLKCLSEKSTPYLFKHFILNCLESLDSIKLLLAYVPVLKEILPDCKNATKESHIDLVSLLLKKFTPLTAKALADEKIANVLIDYLQVTVDGDTKTHKPIHLVALDVVSKDFFSALPSDLLKKRILEILLNLYINSTSRDNSKIGKTLKKLCTFAHLLLRDFEFGDEKANKIVTTLKEAKRSKLDNTEKEVSFDSCSWKQIIVLLEIVQNKSRLDKKELLIPILFNLLNKTLSVENQPQLEYLRQLILSTIHNCCEQLGTAGLDERQFRVEIIVQCIRTSTSPKTHHQSLLLLNLAASMFPEYVLNNVMSIFTFMGNTLVRQDNSYSFQVISQTIETIVPAFLEASSRQTDSESTQAVAAMIRVFVDSLVDIPGHRQLPVFTKLLTTLNPSKYLWIPLGQICDQYASVFHDIVLEDVNNCKISPILDFAVSLHRHFSPRDQIITCINLLKFVENLPDFKADFDPKQHLNCKEPFDVANHSEKQLQVYKQNILSYMSIWLSSPMFISQISELNLKDLASLKGEYENLLEITLNYLQHTLQLQSSSGKNKPELNNLTLLLYDLVSHINSLLPIELFIRVIRRLLRNNENAIQSKAIELLNAKVEQQYHLFTDENSLLLLKIMKPLIKIVTLEGEDKPSLNQQAALYSLQLLTQKIGFRHPAKFYKVLKVTVNILGNVSESSELTLNALLCLAQLCNCLNVAVLPHINSFMPIVVNLIGSKGINESDECLVLAVITVIQSLVENLGAFLSSFMQTLVYQISLLCAKYSETGKKSICEKLKTTQVLLSKEIALRVLLTAIADSYTKLQSDDKNAIVALMQILDEKLNFSSYDDVTACSLQLQKFYISILDFRHLNSEDAIARNTVVLIEDNIINTLKTFVMKLSVTHFRNFFQKLYQWSSASEEDKYHVHKVFTFYKITYELSKSLKNLFVTMSKVFLRQAASLLDLNNSSKTENSFFENDESMSSQLLVHILDTLNFCFLYDDGKLLDKEYFDAVMQPIVDQLENLSADDLYQKRIENHLASCVAHLMTAVSDNNLWKKLNYQILLKTRHDSPKVRFAALQVIREVVKEMGDSYLVLLPESIPFLAEMMEDESSEVEEECQSVIIEMEKILGEPIRKYF